MISCRHLPLVKYYLHEALRNYPPWLSLFDNKDVNFLTKYLHNNQKIRTFVS